MINSSLHNWSKTKNFLISILCIILIITCVPGIVFSENFSSRATSSSEWPEPYGNQQNIGRSFSNLPTENIVSWSKIRVTNFQSQPLVDDGTLIVIHDKVYAYDAETGTEKWTYSAQSIRSPPAIGGGRFFGGSKPFVALDINTGEKLWSYNLFALTAPTVYKDRVFVSELNKLYAFNVLDGTLEWTFGGYQMPKVAASDDTVYVVCGLGDKIGLNALDYSTGKVNWHYKIAYPSPYPPIIDGESIYFMTSGSIICLNRNNGERKFSYGINGSIDTPLTLTNDRFYFGTKNGVVHGIRISDGVRDWFVDTEKWGATGNKVTDAGGTVSSSEWFSCGITLANNGMVFITGDGTLWVVGFDKSVKWKQRDILLSNSVDLDKDLLAVCNGYLYVAEMDGGNLWAFGPKLPISKIEVKSNSIEAETPIKFDARDSTSENGDVTSYYFDFGDGSNSGWQPEPVVSHTYKNPGTYDVTIQVRDSAGHRSPIQNTTVSVKPNITYITTWLFIIIIIIVVIVIVVVTYISWGKEREERATKKARKRLILSLLTPTEVVRYENTRILYTISFYNKAQYPISDVVVESDVPSDIFEVDKHDIPISMISPFQTQPVTFSLTPKGECGDREVKARFRYYDYGNKKHEEFITNPVKVSVVCPILRSENISPEQWDNIIRTLVSAQEIFTDLPMSPAGIGVMLSQTIQENNLKPLPTVNWSDPSKGTISRYRFFAIGVKGTPYAVQLDITGSGTKSNATLTTWAANPQTLVGFYHSLIDGIEKRVHIRDHLKGTVVIRKVEGDYVDGKRIDVRDSVVRHSNIGGSNDLRTDYGKKI